MFFKALKSEYKPLIFWLLNLSASILTLVIGILLISQLVTPEQADSTHRPDHQPPNYTQIHYRWRNDDGSEAAASWAAAQDTQLLSLNKRTKIRLRFEIANLGGRESPQRFRIEFAAAAACDSGVYSPIPADYSLAWHMATSTNIIDGAATTNVALDGGLTDEGSAFVAGETKTLSNTTDNIRVRPNNFTEIEYSLEATPLAQASASYCFRLTDRGSTTDYTYIQYPRVMIAGEFPPSGELTSPTFDTYTINGANFNWLMIRGATAPGSKVRAQFAASNSPDGPFIFLGPDCTSGTFYYDSLLPSPAESREIKCYAAHNNRRYFRYKVILCSDTSCAAPGLSTPQVDEVIVNWSP